MGAPDVPVNLSRIAEVREMMARLQDPFPAKDVEWRVARETRKGQAVQVLAYLTARAIQQRLDEVATPFGWRCSYHEGPDGGVVCRLELLGPHGWVSKEDGASNTQVEAVKGGISGALKRAAVTWGIGRYLYDLPRSVVPLQDRGDHPHKSKETGAWKYWNAPTLPKWALPGGGWSPAEAPAPVDVSSPKNEAGDLQANLQASAPGNVGNGELLRCTTDAFGYDIENVSAEAKKARCLVDQNSGARRGSEVFQIDEKAKPASDPSLSPAPTPDSDPAGERRAAVEAFEALFTEHEVGDFERGPLVLWAAMRLDQRFTWADIEGNGDHAPSIKSLRATYGILKRGIPEALAEIRAHR